jgi:hypothetical protein
MMFGLFLFVEASAVAQPPRNAGVPETFGAKAQAENATGATVSAPILIHVERYTPDFDRKVVEDALKFNGYPGFLPALRKAPNVGYVELGGQKFTIRWARQTPSSTGRTIVVVTDKPVAFLGSATNTKPRAGYEVALIQLKVDAHGEGTGTMAAAARVKPGGETGVQVDDFAEAPIVLVNVTRK